MCSSTTTNPAVRSDDVPTVQNDGAFLSQHPSVKILIEGHCDDRGSEEYNLALGTSRAESVKQALVQRGSPPSASGRSASARRNHSVPRTTNSAGSRTGLATSYSNAEQYEGGGLLSAAFRPAIRYRLRFQFFIPGTVDRCTMPSLGDRLDSSKAVDLFWFSIRMA